MNLKFKKTNGNPWRRNLPDCTFRNMSLALNMNYKSVCEALGYECISGWGLPIDLKVQGINSITENDLPDIETIIKTFDKYFDNYDIDKIYDDNYAEVFADVMTGHAEYDDEYVNPDEGFTINEHIRELAMPKGLYVYWIRPSRAQLQRKDCSPDWHTTFVSTKNYTLYDTFDCTEDGIVYGWAKIKESARIQNSSTDPISWIKFAWKVNRGYSWGKFVPPGWTLENWKNYVEQVKNKDKTRQDVFKSFPYE